MTQNAHDLHGPGRRRSGSTCPGWSSDSCKKKRSESIFLGLPDALDLMVVCVEAGLGLDAAMRRVTSELADVVPGPLRGVRDRQLPGPDGPAAQGRAPRPGHPHRRRRRAVARRRDHPGREVRLEHRRRPCASSPTRCGCRRRQLAEERAAKTAVKIMIPLDPLHLPRRLRRPGRARPASRSPRP